jgi:hypothetical protein
MCCIRHNHTQFVWARDARATTANHYCTDCNQAPLKIRAAMNKERLKTSLAKNSTASASRIKNATKGD